MILTVVPEVEADTSELMLPFELITPASAVAIEDEVLALP